MQKKCVQTRILNHSEGEKSGDLRLYPNLDQLESEIRAKVAEIDVPVEGIKEAE